MAEIDCERKFSGFMSRLFNFYMEGEGLSYWPVIVNDGRVFFWRIRAFFNGVGGSAGSRDWIHKKSVLFSVYHMV